MNEIYVANHRPRFNYLMDIREFNALESGEIPKELFNLDILDGSPPCTTFSTAGEREKNWGKAKKFREGQKEQTLDDLSFIFIETAKKLKPKVVVMENVEGLLIGNAWKYVQRIYREFKNAGYLVHHWLLKGEQMGIPQQRHRAIFIAIRADQGKDPATLDMSFNYRPITFGEIRSEEGRVPKRGTTYLKLMEQRIETDKDFKDLSLRVRGKATGFCNSIIHDNEVCKTFTAKGMDFRYCDGLALSNIDLIHGQTFPEDYDFKGSSVQYVIGMSVPPVMIKRVVEKLTEQGVLNHKEEKRQ